MSRRKQSIPCKVQGFSGSPLPAKTDTSLQIAKLHELTDSLLDGNSTEQDAKVSATDFSHPNDTNDFDADARAEIPNAVDPSPLNETDISTSCIPGGKDTDQNSPLGADEGQSRLSVRLRPRIALHPDKENEKSTSGNKRKFDDCDAADNKTRKVLCLTEEGDTPRERAISTDEELTCPICYKSFMSKYGLLTHSEVHSTPELKCAPCNMNFLSRSTFVAHQINIHHRKQNSDLESPMSSSLEKLLKKSASPTNEYNIVSGFYDLSFVDFTCKKFTKISENVCSKSLHRLSERDRQHFFLCKLCNLLYPTLFALQFHMKNTHPSVSSESEDLLPEEDPKVMDVDDKVSLKETNLSRVSSVEEEHHLTLDEVLEITGLVPKSGKEIEDKKPDDADNTIRYGMDSNRVRTSPMVAYVNVPKWMREDGEDGDFFDLFTVNTGKESPEERPPLKMKLVRRRGEEGKDAIQLAIRDYFVHDDPDTIKSKAEAMENWDSKPNSLETVSKSGNSFSCKICGDAFPNEAALGGHKAGSMCGIGVRTSANGRRMFWCRLCNYASFEKSTILRHQRTHTGVRPYSCRFCNIAFTTKANCERHIRKRHRVRVGTDTDVKNAVHCDYDLLKKARDGEIDLAATTKGHGNRYYSSQAAFSFQFQCRLCKNAFSSRSNGARHVMVKHGVTDRKKANDAVVFFRAQDGKAKKAENQNGKLNEKERKTQYSLSGSIQTRRASASNLQNNHLNNNDHAWKAKSSHRAKPPKLIPLFKIQAYHDASEKMLKLFERNYNEIVSTTSNKQDPEQLLSKIVSLLGTTSSMRKQNFLADGNANSVFTPVDSLPAPSVFRSLSRQSYKDASERIGRANSFLSINESEDDLDHDNEDFRDMAQLFADGDYSANTDGATNDNLQQQGSPGDESPFKPWKNSSSSLMLRDFAANGRSHSNSHMAMQDNRTSSSRVGQHLSSMKDLVNFVNKSSLVPSREKAKRSQHKSNFHSSRSAPSSGSGLRGKYRMVLAKPKPDQDPGSKDKLALTWRFIPEPPRTRDERGRYVRNPNAPHSSKSSSLSSFRRADDRPTMVSSKGGRFHLNVNRRRTLGLSHRNHSLKGRKCPKCDKVFPWASSLSRHIMTHTGYKPFMCTGCSMRFTTRSNLLRHAYRRHGLQRGSEGRHDMLVTLSLREQKEYAEKEAQKLVEMDEESAEAALQMHEQNEVDGEDADTSSTSTSRKDMVVSASVPEDAMHFNKRYICGLCKLPFANRSNVVRHLHRLHDITKDHPNFRSLLVKIRNRVLAPAPTPSLNVNEDDPTPEENQQLTTYSPPPTMVNGFDPPLPSLEETFSSISSSPSVSVPMKLKPFTCGICSIGFTKRNNCARHITHQHSIDRRSDKLRSLIIRNDMTQNNIREKNDEIIANEPMEANVTLSPPPLDPDLPELPSSPDALPMNAGEDHDSVQDDANPPFDLSVIKKEPEGLIQREEEEKLSSLKEDQEGFSNLSSGKRRRSSSRRKIEGEASMAAAEEEEAKPRKKNIRHTHFGCGVCKRIFKDVKELKEHLEEHNIPHPWHCTICGVPFTNKYNCQRHLLRRHGSVTAEPKYVEDVRHGPRSPRKRSKTYGR